jgi:tetratricopeptide (TPR) repeat protein
MKYWTSALVVVLGASAAPGLAQYNTPAPSQQQTPTAPQGEQAKQPELRPSSKAIKAIIDLQKAVNANDVATIPAKVAAAQAVASTKEDKYIIAQLQLKAAIAAKDNAAMAAAIDAVAASGFVDSAKVAGLYDSLGTTFYNAKQFDQAAAAFEKAISIDPRNAEALSLLGEARFAQGRKPDAVSAFQRSIQASLANGQKPQEAVYKRALGIAYDAQMPVAVELGRQWAAAYPSVDSWKNSIAIYRNMAKPDVEGTLDLLRLMQLVGALNSAADYNLFATAAADQSNFNEAQAVIDQGLAAKIVDPASPLFRDTIAGLKSKPKATDADLAAAAKTATSGMALLRIGDRYYGMGQFAKAADIYRQSMGKPGVDPNIANIHLGMALARLGDKAGAKTAFSAVTGPRADIAKFWLLYLQSQG